MKGRCLWCYQDLPKSRTKPREFCGPTCKMAYARNVRHIFQRYEVAGFAQRVAELMKDLRQLETLPIGAVAKLRLLEQHPLLVAQSLYMAGSQAGEPDNSSVSDGRGSSPFAAPITEG